MAFKNNVPQKNDAAWGDYWKNLKVGDDVENCETDGLLPIFAKYLPKNGRILEAGCGLGKWNIFLKKRGIDIEGVDFYEEGIKKIKKYDPKLKVYVGDVEHLPIKENSLDAYLSFGVVEHWEEGPQKPLTEALRVLKPGGIAIIETPCNTFLQKLNRFVDNTIRAIKLPAKIFVETLGLRKKREEVAKVFYEYHYSPSELSGFVQKAGFKIVEVCPKDDTSPNRSLGLWLDFPALRKKNASEFFLNDNGKIIKKLLLPFPWFWSYCVVVVAKKP